MKRTYILATSTLALGKMKLILLHFCTRSWIIVPTLSFVLHRRTQTCTFTTETFSIPKITNSENCNTFSHFGKEIFESTDEMSYITLRSDGWNEREFAFTENGIHAKGEKR